MEQVQGREVEWTLGFAFAEIRNPSAGAVPFPSTQKRTKEKKKGRDRKGMRRRK